MMWRKQVTAVTLIPASGEFAYEVEPVERDAGKGVTTSENVHHQMRGHRLVLVA